MIIGLSGYASSGKDSVASWLVEKHGFHRFAFGDAIRDLLYYQNPRVAPDIHDPALLVRLQKLVDDVGWDEAKQCPEVRELLQLTGQGARESISDTVWLIPMMRAATTYHNLVVSDVRMLTEATDIRWRGGFVTRVTRPGFGPVNESRTEIEMDNYLFDALIYNNDGMDYLHDLTDAMLEKFTVRST